MLTQLIDLLEKRHNGLGLDELSRELGAHPSAVAGMIEVLVRKGRLIEIGPDGGCCTVCPAHSDCNLLASRGTRYVAVPKRDERFGARVGLAS
jgi:hypothetical protein